MVEGRRSDGLKSAGRRQTRAALTQPGAASRERRLRSCNDTYRWSGGSTCGDTRSNDADPWSGHSLSMLTAPMLVTSTASSVSLRSQVEQRGSCRRLVAVSLAAADICGSRPPSGQLAQAFTRQASGGRNVIHASPTGDGLDRSEFQQRQQAVVQSRVPSAKFRYRFVIGGHRLEPSLPRAALLLPFLFVC